MKRLDVAATARADLLHVHLEGIRLFGPNQANRYLADMERQFELVARFPEAAPIADVLDYPVRCLSFRSHIIIYAVRGDVVEILRVRHVRENWSDNP